MKKQLITGSLLVGSLLAPAMILADDAATATPVATPTPLTWYQKVTVGGYIDEYYQHSFNNPTGVVSNGVSARVFDNTANQFTFGGGELTFKLNDAASGTGYFVDLIDGDAGSVYNAGADELGLFGNEVAGANAFQDRVTIGQAYITQAFGPLTFTLGKFATPVGYEVAYLPSNANFSRSLLYSQEPFFNTGLRLDYALPAGFTLSGFIDDGNSTNDAITRGKDYGAIVAYSGIKNLSLTGLWYLNNGAVADNGGIFVDNPVLTDIEWGNFIATYQAMDSLSFAGEYLIKEFNIAQFGAPYNPIEQGYALYATYNTPIANLSVSPRFEQWFNPDFNSDEYSHDNIGGILGEVGGGYSAAPAVTDDYTLTVKYQMGPLAHILEYRADATNQLGENFYTTNGSKNFLTDIQQTLTYAAVYSF